MVGPGSYNDHDSYLRHNKMRCLSLLKDRHHGTDEPHWVVNGHLTKYEPGFVTRQNTKVFTKKGLNVNNKVPPTFAFRRTEVNMLTNSGARYVTSEQTKVEMMKTYTAQGDTIQADVTPFLTMEQVLKRPTKAFLKAKKSLGAFKTKMSSEYVLSG